MIMFCIEHDRRRLGLSNAPIHMDHENNRTGDRNRTRDRIWTIHMDHENNRTIEQENSQLNIKNEIRKK